MKRIQNLMTGALIVAAALLLSSYSSSDDGSNSELVDLGIGIGGAKGSGVAPLLFATGNLIASSSNFNASTPTVSFRIADYANGEYVAQQASFPGYAVDYTSERDLFKVGKVNSPSYWTNDNDYPTAPSENFAGSATEDLIRYAALQEANIPDTYRSATNAEWQAIWRNCPQMWVTKDGISGFLIYGASDATSRDGKDYSVNEIFLPATGFRDGTSVYIRGTYGFYWSGTLYSSNTYFAYSLYFNSWNWYTSYNYRYYGFALRPVSPSPSE
jgi:hypothetical protein